MRFGELNKKLSEHQIILLPNVDDASFVRHHWLCTTVITV